MTAYLSKKNIADIYPLTPMQQGMLFHTVFDPDSSTYFEQFCCVLHGQVDYSCFEKAWNHLIKEHPVFRTVFNWKDAAKPVQIVLHERPVTLGLHDYSGRDGASIEGDIEEFIRADRANLFDLTRGPLMRFNLIRMDADRHYFVWSYHHILFDGWCLGHIMSDFLAAYMAIAGGQNPPSLRRPPYKNYISWLAKQDREKPKAFWTELLKGFTTPTPLPLDFRKPGAGTWVEKVETRLSEDLTRRIEEFARRQRVTMSTMVQAAWSVMLGRYGSVDDVVFGMTVSGRPAELPGADQMIGLFINTLPVRARLDGTVEGLLRALQDQSARIQEFSHTFLPEVRACSQVAGTQNLFDSIVVFENYPLDAVPGGPGRLGISGIRGIEMTNFDLCLVIAPGAEMHVALSYASARFKKETAERMLRHLERLLDGISTDASVQVSSLEIVTDEERDILLRVFNDTAAAFPEDRCIQEFIEEQVDAFPDRIALSAGSDRLTYREMDGRANRLAHYLRSRGVGKDVPVGVFIDRSIDMVIAVLGIIKAGGAYVPIDPEYPVQRIEYILSDCGARQILTQSHMTDRISSYRGEVLCMDRDWERIASMSDARPPLANGSRDLVYLIYTSGSTGNPKGIEIEHRGLVNYILWAAKNYGLRGHGGFPLYTSMTFDLTVTSLFAPLVMGEKIEIMPPDLDPSTLVELVLTSDVDVAKLTPAHLEIADTLTANGLAITRKLNRMILGGEALSAKISRSMLERHPGLVIYNEYGPAETVVGCIVYPFSSLDPECTSVPIGKPIDNTRIYVLDHNQKLLPVGVTGEIYISSPGVARGYLNKPEVSARSFLADPFVPGGRMYRTGDLARWMPDGNMEYLGRVDHQVKIRGFRIELGEVEAVLSRYEGIHDCAVVAREERSGSKYLAAFYVASEEIQQAELKSFLKEKLPEYMVPSRFMRMDQLPLTPNGKVDRRALPEADALKPDAASEYVPPRNEAEEALCEVWKEVLGVERVGIRDNFFDLGGDSIVSLQVVGRLKKRGYEIRPKDIFEYQTVAELAAVAKVIVSRKAEQGPVTGEAPLIPIHRWFYGLGLANVNHFNQHLLFRSAVKLDAESLRKSVQASVEHHDALRARFADGVMRIESASEAVRFEAKEVADRAALEAEVSALQGSLDIVKGPVFAGGLFRMGDAEYVLFVAHHMVIDGVSWRVLLEDVFTGYAAAAGGKAIELPEKTTSYLDWARRVSEHAKGPWVKDETAYWEESLAGTLPALGFDQEKGPNTIQSIAFERVELDATATGQLLRDAHRAYNTEVNDLLLAALTITLQQVMNSDRVAFDLEGHGREDLFEGMDVSRTVGWFTTIYPVVMECGRGEKLSAIVKYAKERLHSIPNRGFNYGVIKYLSGDGKGLTAARPQVVFNYLGQVKTESLQGFDNMTDSVRASAADPKNARSHVIDINCKVEGGKLLVDLGYSTSLHRADTIRGIGETYRKELLNVLAHCMAPESFDITPSDFKLAKLDQEDLDSIYD